MTIKVQKLNYALPICYEGKFKVIRNVESSVPKIQILENLIKTLIKTELIKLGAFDRWNPYINHYQTNFLGLVAILDLFRDDSSLISRLRSLHKMRKKLIRHENVDIKKYLSENYNLRQTLVEKIHAAFMPERIGFKTTVLK